MIEIKNSRVIDAEKRRRKISDSTKTVTERDGRKDSDSETTAGNSSSSSRPSKTLFTNFKSRLLSRRNKGSKASRKTAESSTDDSLLSNSAANIRQKKPEALPAKVVLHEGDTEAVMTLKRFLTEKLEKQERAGNENTGNQIVNDIWKDAVEEFKRTLTALVVQGFKDLYMSQLVRNFEEAFDKQIEKQTTNIEQQQLPRQLYINSFRQTLEDYITERGRLRSAKHRPKREPEAGTGQHHFVPYRVMIQSNTCAACTQKFWFMDKVEVCEICKRLIHKDCLGDPRLPPCKSDSSRDGEKLFGVHLQRVCKTGAHTPEFVLKVLMHLELHGILKEGLYRVSGAKIEENGLKQALDADPFCSKLSFDDFNVHCVASIFKSFLRQLPMPLLPYDVSISIFTGPKNSTDIIMKHFLVVLPGCFACYGFEKP